MKKQFTTAFMMAAAIASAQAQVVLNYDGGIENKPDTVNWYGDWVEAGGEIDFNYTEGEDGKSVNIYTPDGAGTANDWERCLKFDGLQIKPNTIYRVRLTATCDNADAQIAVALMCGDENRDMKFVAPDGKGGYVEFGGNVQNWEVGELTTKSMMFYYTSDEYQQEIYPSIKHDDKEPLLANRFLRLSFKSEGEYVLDKVVVEEANVAGVTFNGDVLKVDFGFPTNAASLAKAEPLGAKVLDASLVTVTVNGEAVVPESVEIKSDGALYIFLGSEYSLGGDEDVKVSFNNAGIGLVYDGNLTPGNGKEVIGFEGETAVYDENLEQISIAYEPAELATSYPQDGSFEMDNDTKEYTFTFNKPVFVCGENAPTATLIDPNGKETELVIVEQENEVGTTIKFKLPEGSADLNNGTYTIIIPEQSVLNEMGVPTENAIRIDFEVGKIQVADIEYSDYATVGVIGENGMYSENWTSYYNGDIFQAQGADIRTFKFPADGKFDTGFYLSQRSSESGSQLTYGENPEYPFALPKGNIQITILCSAWQGNSGSFGYELLDENGNLLAQGSGSAEVHQADANTPVSDYSRVSFTLENFKGADNVVLRLSTNSGGYGNAIIVWGLDVKTYTMSEGVSSDAEVVINEDFSGVDNGKVPEAGTGWNIYDNNNIAEKGVAQSGRNRVMDLGSCTNMTRGFYNRCFGDPATYYMTYGEDDLNLEDDIAEPTLTLSATKYNFSWLACNWKGEKNTYYFAIYDEEGEQVYYREDDITANVNGGTESVAAEKIEFSFTPAKAGRYILKWWMTGESVVGKIKIEKMGSLAAFYHSLLNEALGEARNERANAEEDMYAGTTRDKLDQAIEVASHPNFHTGAEFMDAIAELKAYVDAMAARRAAMAEYSTLLENCAKLLYGDIETGAAGLEGTKYENLEAYAALVELYNQYKEVNPSTLEDEELLPVQEKLSVGYNYCNNMKSSVVALYTTQIDRLVQKIAKFDTEGTYTGHDDIIAAGNALTDDQELAVNLQKMLTAVLYQRIATGYDFTTTKVEQEIAYDENGMQILDENDEPVYTDVEYTEPEEIDLAGYIQNADIYCLALKNEKENIAPAKAMQLFPGWEVYGGNINVAWSWDQWDVTEVLPAANGRFATPWGASVSVEQTVNNLPVGVYKYTVDTGDGSHMGDNYDSETGTFADGFENKSTIFYTIGEEKTSAPFNLASSNPWRGMATDVVEDITLPAGEHNLASITIGADMAPDGDFANVDNFRLYLVAKAEGFDYAAAAAALKQEIADAIVAPEERNDAPVSVVYYNMAGMKSTQPKGVSIKVERWADGYMRVSKTLNK